MKKYKILGWNPNIKIPSSWVNTRKIKFPQTGKTKYFPYVEGDGIAVMINTKKGRRWFWAGWFIYEEV